MSMVRIDPDAHEILSNVKKEMKINGINGATFSDAIRQLYKFRRAHKSKSVTS
jgi:predicted CopG family antitoxin